MKTAISFDSQKNIANREDSEQNTWQILKHVYHEFAANSTVHGIKYTSQAKSAVGRCLWLLIVALSIIAASQLAKEFYEKHESANMRTLVITNQYPSWQLGLPAITFCHSDVAAKHRLVSSAFTKKHIRYPFGLNSSDLIKSLKHLSIGILPSNQFEKELYALDRILFANKMELEKLVEIVRPRCRDFLVMCLFEGKAVNCESIISESYTPYGICCSFNYAYNKNERRWNISGNDYYTVTYGGRYILSFLLKSNGPNDRISSIMYGDGIKVLIHDRKTYPGTSAMEFIAATGQETVARLYGRRLTASQEVLDMKREDRGCERSRETEDFYRADNCYAKCQENIFWHFCGCLPFFSYERRPYQAFCNITHISCLTRIKPKAYSLVLNDPNCGCLPDCENSMYSLTTTSLPFNAPQFNPSPFYKKASKLTNPTAIHVTYSEQSAMLQRRELVLSWINLVSSLGGVFSLFLGCSFVSIIEIIYFFVIYFGMKLREARQARINSFRTA
ncbi:sodium channel protein Nach-like [Venturia canescens]|uniref:sodium channel protein Nach-like n=1 Tax=Venturia canescens TaxID=32260 RepID=UPI001C9CE4DC|nr:sodium channel protein Nach-like [Venturia canescens]